MANFEQAVAAEETKIEKRKKAIERKARKTGQKAGLLDERKLKKLLKQAQRRKAKLVKDQNRRLGKGKKEES